MEATAGTRSSMHKRATETIGVGLTRLGRPPLARLDLAFSPPGCVQKAGA